uniref:C2H2-type domain-containing protein n=3 Tax=Daphnia magna TaxID=35525 RepID=A0A0P5J8D4_9CRUS
MDSYQKKNRGHNNHHSNYHSNYRDHSSNRDSFDGSYGGSSRSDSVSPNSHRKTAQLTFECRVCLNTYQSKRELNSHLHAAQHLRSLSRATLPENDQHFPSRKRVFLGFSCKVCSHQFETHSELRKHLSDFDHHWTPKRSREMSNQDRNSYKHENNLRRHRHQSSTDVRSDKSLDWPNRDLFDAENERAKSSLSLRSYGSTDLILDTPVTMLEKNARILNDGIYNSRTEKTYEVNVKVHKHSSNYETDNDPSFITSPDNSVLLQSKVSIEVSSMSESHKGVAVIPTESATRTKDPRQNFLCSRSDAVRTQPKIQNTKWAPVYCDRSKSSLVEKKIPWKLIPIDFSSESYNGNLQPDGGTLAPTVPSPTEEIPEVSIDQLAAQLKENTGATFIPHLRMSANVSHSTISSEKNLLIRFNRDLVSSHVSSTSFSEEQAVSQSPTPSLDKANSVPELNSSIKISERSIENSAAVKPGDEFDLEPWHPDSTSLLPLLKYDQATNPEENTIPESANSLPSAEPISIPPAVIDHQVEADILKALETLSPMVSATVLSASVSISSCSSQVLISNTNNAVSSQCTLPVLRDDIDPVLPGNNLISIPAIEMRCADPVALCAEPTKETECSFNHSDNSSTSSCEPVEEPVTIEELTDSCPCCQTVLDIGCLKIDLNTGNASVHCLECSVHIVMRNAFMKMR